MSPAGPYPTKAQFQALDARTKVTVLDAGDSLVASPKSTAPTTVKMIHGAVLTGNVDDIWVAAVGVSVNITAADVREVWAYDSRAMTGFPVSYGVMQSVEHPSVPLLPAWSVIMLAQPMRVPGGGALRVMFKQPVSATTFAYSDGGGTPGASMDVLDVDENALGGLLYLGAYPPDHMMAGRLPRNGMRRVRAPSLAFEPGDFEIVDEAGQVPYLRYLSLDGREVTWPGMVAGSPPSDPGGGTGGDPGGSS